MKDGIKVDHVSKVYGSTRALDDVSLCFEENKIYGLLGRNGAGKSTLLNIITNRIFPDGGKVTIGGLPARENDKALSQVYLMSEQTCYPESMRIREVFKWTKNFYPEFDLENAQKLAQLFGLNLQKKVKELSTGYGSIFKLIIALSLNLPFILLDEPVLGLDANHRDLFYRLLVESYSERPRTIVISTHLIEEVANVIEHVVIIKEGKIIENEATETLLARGYTISGLSAAVDAYIAGKQVLSTESLGGLKTAYLMGQLEKEALPEGLEATKLDLQKLFIQLTNQ